jgi:hypothetical protein
MWGWTKTHGETMRYRVPFLKHETSRLKRGLSHAGWTGRTVLSNPEPGMQHPRSTWGTEGSTPPPKGAAASSDYTFSAHEKMLSILSTILQQNPNRGVDGWVLGGGIGGTCEGEKEVTPPPFSRIL